MEKRYNYFDSDFTGQDFSGQDLSAVSFRNSNLTNCNFIGANVSFAQLRECNMTGANFTDANLSYSNMIDTIIEGASFTRAVMHYSNMKNAVGSADFTDAKIKMSPKWITMADADDTTEPPSYMEEADRRTVITAFITQAVIPLNDADMQVVKAFMDHGTRGVVTGTYGEMPDVHKLYEALNEEAPQEIAYMLNAVMDQDLRYEDDEYSH